MKISLRSIRPGALLRRRVAYLVSGCVCTSVGYFWRVAKDMCAHIFKHYPVNVCSHQYLWGNLWPRVCVCVCACLRQCVNVRSPSCVCVDIFMHFLSGDFYSATRFLLNVILSFTISYVYFVIVVVWLRKRLRCGKCAWTNDWNRTL